MTQDPGKQEGKQTSVPESAAKNVRENQGGGVLRLKALDSEDLKVVSACLQDALVPMVDVAFLPQEHRLVMVASRFMWERLGKEEDFIPITSAADKKALPLHYRVHCGITFEAVSEVKSLAIDLKDRNQLLNILAITAEEKGIVVYFSGGAALRLSVSQIRCYVKDLGEPWPIFATPHHET